EQADALLLFFEQGKALPRGARKDVRRHPHRRAGAEPARRLADRRRAPADRVHLEIFHCAPGIPHAAQQRKSAPGAAFETVEADPRDEFAADRDARDAAGPWTARRLVPLRCRSAPTLHFYCIAQLLLPVEQAYAGPGVRTGAVFDRTARHPP